MTPLPTRMKAPMTTLLRTLQSVLVLVGLQLTLAQAVLAQPYPAKPIRVVVPWPAGGLVDVAARQLTNRLQPSLGQAIVVENKLGAGGSIGADAVAKAPVDGLWHYMVLALVSVASVLAVPIGAVEGCSSLCEGAIGARRGRTLGAWKDLQGALYNIEHTTCTCHTARCAAASRRVRCDAEMG